MMTTLANYRRAKYRHKAYNRKLSAKARVILELCQHGATNVTGLYVEPLINAGWLVVAERDGKQYGVTTQAGKERLRHD